MIRAVASLIASIAFLSAACGREPVSSSRAHLEEMRALVRSESASTRAIGAAAMIRMCCPTTGERRPEAGEACGEVNRLLGNERDAVVLDELLSPWGPDCYREIAPSTLIELASRPNEITTREKLVDRLGEVDPSPAIVDTLLAQLGRPGRSGTHDVPTSVALALGAMGEDDLGPVVEALSANDVAVRRGAARTFAIAAKAPLDLPPLPAALERATSDPDPETADHARQAAASLAARAGEPPDAAVTRLLEDRSVARQTIRFFALRRFACASPAAAAALDRFRSGDDPELSAAASRAIALRARRCGR
jgi:hypothetical protein